MKKNALVLISACFIFTIVLESCSTNAGSKISSGNIKSLVTENLQEKQEAVVYDKVKVGYYEDNSDEHRFILRKLAAAGVITYDVERVESSSRVKNGYTIDYRTYRVVDTYKTVKKTNYFVTVALTETGQLYVVDEIPKYVPKEDKYLKPVEYVHYPEFDVPEEEVFPEDNQEVVPAEEATEKQPDDKETPSEPKNDYERAKAKEHFEFKNVKCYSVKVVDIRDIRVLDGRASANYVLEAFDVTPFGRVLNRVYEKSHTLGEASFSYYQDKKWVVDKTETADLFI